VGNYRFSSLLSGVNLGFNIYIWLSQLLNRVNNIFSIEP
jgi:hypothetical protein